MKILLSIEEETATIFGFDLDEQRTLNESLPEEANKTEEAQEEGETDNGNGRTQL